MQITELCRIWPAAHHRSAHGSLTGGVRRRVEVFPYVRSGVSVTPTRPGLSRLWKRRMRVTGARFWSAVEGWTAPGPRPERSESEVSVLVAVVTAAAGGLILLTMLLTWLVR